MNAMPATGTNIRTADCQDAGLSSSGATDRVPTEAQYIGILPSPPSTPPATPPSIPEQIPCPPVQAQMEDQLSNIAPTLKDVPPARTAPVVTVGSRPVESPSIQPVFVSSPAEGTLNPLASTSSSTSVHPRTADLDRWLTCWNSHYGRFLYRHKESGKLAWTLPLNAHITPVKEAFELSVESLPPLPAVARLPPLRAQKLNPLEHEVGMASLSPAYQSESPGKSLAAELTPATGIPGSLVDDPVASGTVSPPMSPLAPSYCPHDDSENSPQSVGTVHKSPPGPPAKPEGWEAHFDFWRTTNIRKLDATDQFRESVWVYGYSLVRPGAEMYESKQVGNEGVQARVETGADAEDTKLKFKSSKSQFLGQHSRRYCYCMIVFLVCCI
eukprot:TRINITY_DN10660_c0_g1_i2.p1 TRINITY_DN10660_c0_g1~~TRINITY_DN10660_c0_g1_i2.p1  ORF type:complete len:384 (+),score=16.52 TRINITY_DN10660_c0_g1_i2:134-1285(+)